MLPDVEHDGAVNEAFARERQRIIGLCARISGDASVAEDLAQETFVEAWRQIHKLHSLDGLAPWLSAIARNVCMRWRSHHGREALHLLPSADGLLSHETMDDWLADDNNAELEIEHHELAELLDRALALLPPLTRAVLVERFLAESTLGEIAVRLDMSLGAVKMRLQRGKVALRGVLTEQFGNEVTSLGCIRPVDGWHETQIWCFTCGNRRLEGRFDPVKGDLVLRCPACYPAFGVHESQTYGLPSLFSHADGIADGYSRLVSHAGRYFQQALADGAARCINCNAVATVLPYPPPYALLFAIDAHGPHVRCPTCGHISQMSLGGLALSLPELWHFRQTHQRIRMLPQYQVEADGQPAIVVGFQSLFGTSRREVVVGQERLTILRIH